MTLTESKSKSIVKPDQKTIAYHEAGHVIAFILAGIKFKYVTIKSKRRPDGHMMWGRINSSFDPVHFMVGIKKEEMTDPLHFSRFFISGFINCAGMVAEYMYFGKYCKGSGDDFLKINDNLSVLPKFLQDKCYSFLAAYTSFIFQSKIKHIKLIANELLSRETLSYDDVIDLLANIPE